VSRISEIKNFYNSTPEVKRIHELEHYIDTNLDIKNKLIEIKNKQKQMVNAKECNLVNQYNTYESEYKALKEELLDMPFVEEYLELLEIVDDSLNTFSNEIEEELNKLINK